jgi:AcrR family transcriptional regulator
VITPNILIATRRKKGRPLSFDRDAALHKAMLLFWEHGYEATSLNDLTSELGITPSSIYSAFGDKKGLFFDAVKMYLGSPATLQTMLDEARTARAAAATMLEGAATGFTGTDTPRGCLLASAAISCSDSAADVRQTLGAIRQGMEAQLRARIQDGITRREMPEGTDAEALAAMTMAVIQGMSTAARDGAPREKLLRIAAAALQAWPVAVQT